MKIISLNIRKWSRDLNPFDWNHWWVVRTWRQRKFFKKEKPDVICLQERWWPIGKLFLGLWGYECYGGWRCPIPVYVKKRIGAFSLNKELLPNGHGFNEVSTEKIDIMNVHLPFDASSNYLRDVIFPLASNEIACGDFNMGLFLLKNSVKNTIYSLRELQQLPPDDTFQNYTHQGQHGEIDHFITCTVIPASYELGSNGGYKLSDHKPIICEI